MSLPQAQDAQTSSHIDNAKGVLVIGATSGIGKAIAERFAKLGKKVVVTGRRQERLDEMAKSSQNISAQQWDISDLKSVASTVDKIFKEHTAINTVFLVSGLQRTTDFTKPKELDMEQINLEIHTNFTSYIHVVAALLPHLQQAPSPVLAVVSSQLAIVGLPRTPVYNGTKAAVHQFLLSLRYQLKGAKSPVSIVDILPPSVATELHSSDNQPDLPDDYKEMPMDDFMKELWQALEQGKLDIPVGAAKAQWDKVEKPRIELLEEATS